MYSGRPTVVATQSHLVVVDMDVGFFTALEDMRGFGFEERLVRVILNVEMKGWRSCETDGVISREDFYPPHIGFVAVFLGHNIIEMLIFYLTVPQADKSSAVAVSVTFEGSSSVPLQIIEVV